MCAGNVAALNLGKLQNQLGQGGTGAVVLNSKISKGPILPRSNRGKAASQFFMSLKVFARRFRETATIISQGYS